MAVETEHPDYVAMLPQWKRLRDVIAGEATMRANASLYVRKKEGMTSTDYAAYTSFAPFYEATSRSVDGLTGMAFAQDPVITLPTAMDPFKDDMTLDGVSIGGFVEHLFEEVLVCNRAGVLVDFPPPDETVKNKLEAELANRRPYTAIYQAESIFNWRTAKVNGKRQLVEVRLKEISREAGTDEFDEVVSERIRVLQLVRNDTGWVYIQRLFQPVEGRDKKIEWQEYERIMPTLADQTPLTFIPFWFFNIRDLTDKTLKPPLLGLANANVAHFNTSAQLEHVLSFCGSPQPYITGFKDDTQTFKIGSTEAWTFEGEDTKVGYLTLGTEGVEVLEKRLAVFEQQMAMLGARMLAPDIKGVEAAETAQIHRQGEISVVMAACHRVSTGMTEILRFMAEWHKVVFAPTDIVFKISTAFFEQTMTASEAAEIVGVWQKSAIAYSDVLAKFKAGGLVATDRTAEDIASENQTGIITPASIMLGANPDARTETQI